MKYSQMTWLSSLLSPCAAAAELVGQLGERTGRCGDAKRSSRILKPIPESCARDRVERLAPDHEEAAHRIGEIGVAARAG